MYKIFTYTRLAKIIIYCSVKNNLYGVICIHQRNICFWKNSALIPIGYCSSCASNMPEFNPLSLVPSVVLRSIIFACCPNRHGDHYPMHVLLEQIHQFFPSVHLPYVPSFVFALLGQVHLCRPHHNQHMEQYTLPPSASHQRLNFSERQAIVKLF